MRLSKVDGHRLFRYLAVAAFALCYVTILLGGNVMASDSGLACPDWPTCHGSFFPPLSGATGVEWSHRLSALVLSAATLVLAVFAVVWERARPVLLRLSVGAVFLVAAQAVLGGVVVDSSLSIGIVLAHFALATVLFMMLLVLALVANLRTIPRTCLEWAWTAGDELPPSERIANAEENPSAPAHPGPTSPTR